MVKKKVKGKKGRKKKKKAPKPAFESRYKGFDSIEKRLLAKRAQRTDFVWVDLKLRGLKFGGFSVLLRTCNTLQQILRKIQDKHNTSDDLRLFRSPPADENELKDTRQTLAQLGIEGGLREEELAVTIYYDFRTSLIGPLLLKEPQMLALEGAAELKELEGPGPLPV